MADQLRDAKEHRNHDHVDVEKVQEAVDAATGPGDPEHLDLILKQAELNDLQDFLAPWTYRLKDTPWLDGDTLKARYPAASEDWLFSCPAPECGVIDNWVNLTESRKEQPTIRIYATRLVPKGSRQNNMLDRPHGDTSK